MGSVGEDSTPPRGADAAAGKVEVLLRDFFHELAQGRMLVDAETVGQESESVDPSRSKDAAPSF